MIALKNNNTVTKRNIFILNSSWLINRQQQKQMIEKNFNIFQICDYWHLVELLKKMRPHLFIFEIVTFNPYINEFLLSFEKRPEFYKIPSIVVLAQAKYDKVLLLAQMGFQEVLISPIDDDRLFKILEKFTSKPIEPEFALLDLNENDNKATVQFVKALDASNTTLIDDLVDNLIIEYGIRDITFDLSKVTYLDSSGIGILVVCKKKLDLINGNLRLINLNEHVKNLLIKLQIDNIIEIEDEVIK
jgi:anti-anti-sigma factor